MFKKIIDGFIENPLVASIFATDFVLLLFVRPPFLFSLILLSVLVGCSYYLGQKTALFK